jgi:hypothetical protein
LIVEAADTVRVIEDANTFEILIETLLAAFA